MSHSHETAPRTPTQVGEATAPDDPAEQRARTRAMRGIVLGGVVAILAPLLGFLGGSMVGPAQDIGDYDAMFVSMFVGLVIGGAGAVVAGLGVLRYVRHQGRLY